MKNLPEIIWLNLGDGVEQGDDFRKYSCVTWSEEKIFDNDVEYVRKSQWISVEERLPEDDKRVLVRVSASEFFSEYCAVAYWDGEDWIETQRSEVIRPTHWFPIPPLNPENEER